MHDTLIPYKTMPEWTAQTLPQVFQERHNTKPGTWARLTILSGKLRFISLDENETVLDEVVFDADSNIPFVEPQAWHRVEPVTDDLRCQLTFYCQPRDYVAKKYGLTPTHSEVHFTAPFLSPNSKILDLGSGRGRNSLYLARLGHEVTALDVDQKALALLEEMAETENLPMTIAPYDINTAKLDEDYDAIISTVVFMGLEADSVPEVIANMQEHTNPGGYNLIVCAMDTEATPCPMPFSFTFKEGELRQYYTDWELIKYNENMGELHKRDENGNRLKMQFVTMLARKPH
ncbi:SAM-dependent methyltransferase TehB [Streptococcus moroccensis]|uniref:Tellurite methyltransferase n=1 Tax=Streptococcus moroccensis TaxID=1451356 RepID=A0ABT9YTF9_9STRE|nr:SAM-dependent methyltransferase TehB [Streptococcus moroccensis]MDQ0223258.1 tellurite methyltransferase [Streptococcus moroccensis]